MEAYSQTLAYEGGENERRSENDLNENRYLGQGAVS